MKARIRKYLVIVMAVLGAAIILAAASGIIGEPRHAVSGYYVPVIEGFSNSNITGNVTANQTQNSTVQYNPEWSEINMNLSAVDSALGLDITAQQGVESTMLTNFSVTLRAPGNSSYYITDNALHGGSNILKRGTFSYNTTFSLQGTNSGVANFTFYITSGQLKHTNVFSYLFEFMTPVNYINYEHQKLNPKGSLTWQQGGEIAVGALLLGMFLYRIFLPIMKSYIQKANKKEGLILLAKN